MNAIVNLGNPSKDMTAIATSVLPGYSAEVLKLTGIKVYRKDNLLLTSPAYGAGMTLDSLEEMRLKGWIGANDAIILVGSMGSLSAKINLEDIVLPNPVGCAYYGNDGVWLEQDAQLLEALTKSLGKNGTTAVKYKHGSSFAVFDPHTDITTYTSSLYDHDVDGLDCSEVFIGIQFAGKNGMKVGAVLYCSDSPESHITDVGDAEFMRRASAADLLLNRIAADILTADN
jgi:purine-nucleoside phosphorylase